MKIYQKIVSHLEVFKLEAGFDGKIIHYHAIASVFTPEKYRGKGYASILLQFICGKFENLVLYSDVGTFYERFGFVVSGSPCITLCVSGAASVPATFLRKDHMYDLLEKDREYNLQKGRSRNIFCPLLSKEMFDWQTRRSLYNFPSNEYFGCQIDDEYIWWMFAS